MSVKDLSLEEIFENETNKELDALSEKEQKTKQTISLKMTNHDFLEILLSD